MSIARRGTIKKTGERVVHYTNSDSQFNREIILWVHILETNKSESLFRNAVTWDKQKG